MTSSIRYSKLIADDGLPIALSCALSEIGSKLSVREFEAKGDFTNAFVQSVTRSSQVFIHREDNLLIDFWRDGVQYGDAATKDIREAAICIHRWVGEECSVAELENIEFVQLTPMAKAFDQGSEVEYQWKYYLEMTDHTFLQSLDIFKYAYQAPELRQLFPFTSLDRLFFSRCTVYPYYVDTPFVRPNEDGQYEVFGPDGELIGTGDASAAVQMLVDNLPPNCGPAKRGTAEIINAT